MPAMALLDRNGVYGAAHFTPSPISTGYAPMSGRKLLYPI